MRTIRSCTASELATAFRERLGQSTNSPVGNTSLGTVDEILKKSNIVGTPQCIHHRGVTTVIGVLLVCVYSVIRWHTKAYSLPFSFPPLNWLADNVSNSLYWQELSQYFPLSWFRKRHVITASLRAIVREYFALVARAFLVLPLVGVPAFHLMDGFQSFLGAVFFRNNAYIIESKDLFPTLSPFAYIVPEISLQHYISCCITAFKVLFVLALPLATSSVLLPVLATRLDSAFDILQAALATSPVLKEFIAKATGSSTDATTPEIASALFTLASTRVAAPGSALHYALTFPLDKILNRPVSGISGISQSLGEKVKFQDGSLSSAISPIAEEGSTIGSFSASSLPSFRSPRVTGSRIGRLAYSASSSLGSVTAARTSEIQKTVKYYPPIWKLRGSQPDKSILSETYPDLPISTLRLPVAQALPVHAWQKRLLATEWSLWMGDTTIEGLEKEPIETWLQRAVFTWCSFFPQMRSNLLFPLSLGNRLLQLPLRLFRPNFWVSLLLGPLGLYELETDLLACKASSSAASQRPTALASNAPVIHLLRDTVLNSTPGPALPCPLAEALELLPTADTTPDADLFPSAALERLVRGDVPDQFALGVPVTSDYSLQVRERRPADVPPGVILPRNLDDLASAFDFRAFIVSTGGRELPDPVLMALLRRSALAEQLVWSVTAMLDVSAVSLFAAATHDPDNLPISRSLYSKMTKVLAETPKDEPTSTVEVQSASGIVKETVSPKTFLDRMANSLTSFIKSNVCKYKQKRKSKAAAGTYLASRDERIRSYISWSQKGSNNVQSTSLSLNLAETIGAVAPTDDCLTKAIQALTLCLTPPKPANPAQGLGGDSHIPASCYDDDEVFDVTPDSIAAPLLWGLALVDDARYAIGTPRVSRDQAERHPSSASGANNMQGCEGLVKTAFRVAKSTALPSADPIQDVRATVAAIETLTEIMCRIVHQLDKNGTLLPLVPVFVYSLATVAVACVTYGMSPRYFFPGAFKSSPNARETASFEAYASALNSNLKEPLALPAILVRVSPGDAGIGKSDAHPVLRRVPAHYRPSLALLQISKYL